MNIRNVAILAIVAVVTLSAGEAAMAKDKWGFKISPYGTTVYYKTGGGSYSYSSGYHYPRTTYHRSTYYPRTHYRTYSRHSTTPSYGTYGYSHRADHYGSRSYGYGTHARGYASPYRHGTHHGYHRSSTYGWHGGTHYGHK